MFNIQFAITKPIDPDVIKHELVPALDAVGREWVRMVGDAPAPPADGLYQRTGTMAQRAAYNVDDGNLFVDLGTTHYGRWVLITGSGIFGPRGSVIRPTNSMFFKIPVTNKSSSAVDFAGVEGAIFARSTIGQAPWPNFERWRPLVPEIIKRYLVI